MKLFKKLTNKKGSGELVALILIVLLVVLLAGPKLRTLGNSVGSKYDGISNTVNSVTVTNP